MSDTNGRIKRRKINRQYSEEYLSFGFTYICEEEYHIPQCIVCGEKLSNSAMVPTKLKRHFSTNHANLATKTKDYFKRLLDTQAKQVKYFEKTVKISDKAQLASYKVAEMIAVQLKPHTIAESLIIPACCEMVKIMFGDEATKEIMKIPRSNDTIKNRIKNMSDDIEKTVADKLSKRHFALQIDESTDISGKAHILGFVRFIHENEIVNQFLCCLELTERSTGQDVFDSISSYFEQFKISWELCVGICTDGAPSMVGSLKGFVTLAKKRNANIISTHCFLHRESLVSKTLPVALKPVLDKVVNMVNFIKSRPLKIRVFKNLCISMEAKYESLLLHSEVRWLSRGKVLRRFLELKDELMTFFQNENMDDFVEYLQNDIWCAKLAYLADIFDYLNCVNTSLQGRKENFLTSTDKLTAFRKKVIFWKNRLLEKKKVDIFPSLNDNTTDEIISAVTEHLTLLEEKIEFYFPSINVETYDWIRNPFATVDTSNSKLSYQEEEELINLSSDRTLKIKFSEMVLEEFWIFVQEEYSALSMKALKILLQFSTSYLCELGFSIVTNIKTKKRATLTNLDEELRVAISKIRPNITEICKNRQAQVSH